MAREGWDNLSPDYRSRLEKAGLTKSDYESGRSLSEARGHKNTPEHPKYYDAKKFPQYDRERTTLEKDLERRKRELWGDHKRFNPKRSERNIRERPPPLRLIRWALEADEQDLIDAIREDSETFSFLGYH